MAARYLLGLFGLFSLLSLDVLAQSFSLYPTVDPDILAGALNISVGCLDALNTTLPCDASLFPWTVNADDYFWSEENVTTLCTEDCALATQNWEQNVELACIDDDLIVYGTLVPAFTVAGRYLDGYGVACLQSSTSDWCMIESLSWVGSDVVRPDCSVDPTSQQCMNPANVTADNQRIANLYPDSMLCSECFLKMMFQRITSDYLPDSDYSDYLVAEFQDIQDVCSTTLAPTLSTRQVWNLPTAFPPVTQVFVSGTLTVLPSSTPTTQSVATPTPTQTGMVSNCVKFYEAVSGDDCFDIAANNNITLIDFDFWNPAVGDNCAGLFADFWYCIGVTLDTSSSACQVVNTTLGVTTSNATIACEQLSVLYNVATGDLIQFTGGADCYSENNVCVPASCNLIQVQEGDTCASIADSLTATSMIGTITTTQLLSWNPNIIGICEFLQVGQYICIDAPGGSYVPPPTPTNSADSGDQERGGPGGADPTGITGTSVTQLVTSQPLGSVPTAAPAPTQLGIVSNCNQYSQAASGDSCTSFASTNTIPVTDLYAWNSVLGPGGENCNTMLFAGYYYCIGTIGAAGPTTTSAVPTGSSKPSAVPSPIQGGIVATCNQYASAPAGSFCSQFATDEGITTTELYAWNQVLGANGVNCNTAFFAGFFYCIGIATPIQAGVISTCNQYAIAPSGSFCSEFATDQDITVDNLYAWNTVLGADGANCNTEFFADFYYCVGVATPTQEGIISSCNSYAQAPSGSFCSEFATNEGITTAELYDWNPVLGTDGSECNTEFFADFWYCIGIGS